MKIINQIVILLFLLISFNLLIANITNIEYEGTWARSHNYDWGFTKHGNDFYVGDNTRVEKYHILDNGDLEYASNYEDCVGLVKDIHIAGDSLFLATHSPEGAILSVIDISDGGYEKTAVFENLSDARLDGTFFSSERYVYYITTYNTQSGYYYDRVNHSLNDWDMPCYYFQDIVEEIFVSSEWDIETGKCKIKMQDISNIDDPQLVYLSDPLYGSDVNVKSINDSILVILDMNETENITEMVFWNISDPVNPIQLSNILLECDDWFANPVRPIIVGDNYLYLTTHSNSGNRYIYDISDLENPTLNCSWQTNDIHNFNQAYKSLCIGNNFYTKRGAAGIVRYNIDDLPITEPIDYFGKQYASALWGSYDGERVIYYNQGKIVSKDHCDDEGTILFQSEEIANSGGTFVNNDSLVIVKVIDYTSGLMDLNLIETATGELMNSYEDMPYYRLQYYISPYFYFCNSSNIKVYEVDSEWNLNEIANLHPGSSGDPCLWVREFSNNQIWINSSSKVYIYDTTDFNMIEQFNNSSLTPTGEIPWFKFRDDSGAFCVQYDGAERARIYFINSENELELIQAVNFGEYNNLEMIEDDLISLRKSLPSRLYHFSDQQISEPYEEFSFNNINFMFHFDEENKRIFAFKSRSYESFTYDYFVEADENEVTQPGCSLKNFPNPFNPNTVISFQTSDFSGQNLDETASIEIYNVKGQKVKSFKDLQGKKAVVWHGKDESGKTVGSGVYFYQLQRGEKVLASRKMTLLK